jgi:hypothetical protein
MNLAAWGYRLEAQMPDWFTALRSLAFIFASMFFLMPGW